MAARFLRGIHKKQHIRRAGLAALLVCALATCAFWLAGCAGNEDEPTTAEQAQDQNMSLYEYNLNRGAMALNDYDYSNLESFNGYKYYLTDKKVTSLMGIDVSDHQGKVNWSKAHASGIDFAFIRIGYRGYTEGKISADERYETNIKKAKAAGMKVGVYFFSQATTEDEAREEAAYVIDKLNGTDIDYPVVYDLETDVNDDARTKDLSSDQITANALAFCKAIEEAGYTPMVYLNKNAALYQFDLSQLQSYPLWYAEYSDTPSLGFDFAIWQYTAEGSAFGVKGNVDLDILFDESKLQVKS
ncbi:MAG: glycoside hydrolase family 25 protein [Eggerthellaceae bacterium]|jgi:GH25 family lysozyme M1 (1,4-beta-N-acetylmuramidase)